MAKKSLRQVLMAADRCVVAPCVYDCASARAVEMVGFSAMMLSGGEVSIAMNGVLDYGFTGLADLEWITSRISQTSPLPLAADIEDGFGGPLAVYRSAKRMAMAGASALQLEDSSDLEASTKLLPREPYYAKVRAALAALEGTDCFLIARTNADPATELDEGIERCRKAVERGAQMTRVVKLTKATPCSIANCVSLSVNACFSGSTVRLMTVRSNCDTIEARANRAPAPNRGRR